LKINHHQLINENRKVGIAVHTTKPTHE